MSCVVFWLLLIIFAMPLGFWMYLKFSAGRCKSKRHLSGQVAIVTGAEQEIGVEAVKNLAMRNARVIMACKDMRRGQSALEEVQRETGSTLVTLKQLDSSSMASVRRFAAEILAEETQLHVLVNGAGEMTHEKLLTEDELESNFASNYFGPFLLTNLLLGLMERTGKARIINVSAANHNWFIFRREFDLGNLNSEKSWSGYASVHRRAQLALVLFTMELNRRLLMHRIYDVNVNVLYSGWVKPNYITKDFQEDCFGWVRDLCVRPFLKSAEEGAQTIIELAVSAKLDRVGGEYFEDCKTARTSELAQDGDLAKNLWAASVKFVKLQESESIVFENRIGVVPYAPVFTATV